MKYRPEEALYALHCAEVSRDGTPCLARARPVGVEPTVVSVAQLTSKREVAIGAGVVGREQFENADLRCKYKIRESRTMRCDDESRIAKQSDLLCETRVSGAMG